MGVETLETSVGTTEQQSSPGGRLRELVVRGTFRAVSRSLKAVPWAVSRLTNADAEEAASGPRLLEAGQNPSVQEIATTEEGILDRALAIESGQLQKNALELLHTFREDLGDWMHRDGEVVMRADIDDPYDVTVKTAAHDRGAVHQTEAVIDVAEKSSQQRKHVARMAIRAVEPTIGARRSGQQPVPTETYVEGAGIGIWNPDQTLRAVQTAFDNGDVHQIELVS